MKAVSVARVIFVFICLLSFAQPADARSKWWLSWLDELSGPGPFNGKTLVAELWCVPAEDDRSKIALDASVIDIKTQMAVNQQILDSKALATFMKDQNPGNAQVETMEGVAKQLFAAQSALAAAEKQLRRQQQNRACLASRENALLSVVFEGGQWDDQPNGRYEGNTDLGSYQVVFYFPLHRILRQSMTFENAIPSRKRLALNRVFRAIELGVGAGAYRLSGDQVREDEWWRGSIPFRIRVIPSELFYGVDSGSSQRKPLRVLLQSVQFRFGGDLLPGRLTSDAFVDLEVDERTEWLWTRSVQFDLGTLVWASFRR